MREDIEEILRRYMYEFNNRETRNMIKNHLNYLDSQVANNMLTNFQVTDRTTPEHVENNGLCFQIIYQPISTPAMIIMDIITNGLTIDISDFENNKIGKRYIPPLTL